MIQGKIRNVQDAVCEGCSQSWYGVCRAYSIPHSEEETDYRKSGGKPHCEMTGREYELDKSSN